MMIKIKTNFLVAALTEPIRDNDAKAVGPFIMAGIELQRILDKK